MIQYLCWTAKCNATKEEISFLLKTRQFARKGQRANEHMLPGDEVTFTTRRETGPRGHWYKPIRCSVCTSFILFHPITLKEPLEAPEPRHEWVLCKRCHEALLVEMRRTSIRSPVRLRVAVGLVAAERSPKAYTVGEQWEFQREFTYVMWFLILFTLLHLVIFVILFAVPK